jgi:NTP pyrophosphatase (non-canonical NTP hydrolase)
MLYQSENIFNIIKLKLTEVHYKHGAIPKDRNVIMSILMEEVGEVARAILDDQTDRYKDELYDVISVCYRAIEAADNEK